MNSLNKRFSTGIPFPLHLFNAEITSASGSAVACLWARESSISLTCGFTMHLVFIYLLDFIPLSISFFLALIEGLDGRAHFEVITWALSHSVEVRLDLKSSNDLLITWLRFEGLDVEQWRVRRNRFCYNAVAPQKSDDCCWNNLSEKREKSNLLECQSFSGNLWLSSRSRGGVMWWTKLSFRFGICFESYPDSHGITG